MGGSTQDSAPPGTRLRAAADGGDFVDGMRRASGIGAVAYAVFAGFDVLLALLLYRDARLDLVIACRVAGTGVLFGWYFYARATRASLRSMIAATAVALAASTGLMGLMANQLGGLLSPYVHGLAFYYVGVAVLMPSPWRRMLAIQLPAHLMFVIALGVSTWVDGAHAAQWASREAVTRFAIAAVIETALLAFATLSAHTLWASRAQLYRARRLGRYRLQAPLGHGGMNEVWLARDDNLARDVAIKVLHGAPGGDDDRWQRFEREAQVASSLTSPHTVRIYDYGASDDGITYIAMEYLRGLDLADLVGGFGPLDVRRAIHMIRQAARSLAEAHERGLVHRDIKPANLFALSSADAPDFVKVLDFGLVRELTRPVDDHGLDGQTLGTPAYMAPEQFLGADVTAASDVYGLGATLFFLLTGGPPCDDTDGDAALWRQHATPRLPSVRERRGEEVPAALEAILAQALSKHPADRYPDASALLRALDDLPELGPWTQAEAASWWSSARLTSPPLVGG
ncbi:MAG TPA: serine/threonine-protein kinase [Kofleriaceae bacterium]|jgi:serine/threonine-protein kinase|nr:serine/threonine-protein kinase [Kofleriaceae bacterium]